MIKIVGIGNALVDILSRMDENDLQSMHLPKGSRQLIDSMSAEALSQTLRGDSCHYVAGGACANTLKAMAHMGATACFVGKVADDSLAERFFQSMREAGVDVSHVARAVGKNTGRAYTFVTSDGQRTFATCLGAGGDFACEDFDAEMLDDGDYFFIEGYLSHDHDFMEHAMKMAKQRGAKVCLDYSSYNVVKDDLDFFRRLTREWVDIAFANEEEAMAYCGKKPEEAARKLGEDVGVAVVKMGRDGACAYADGKLYKTRAERVENVVDTTGAGDFFAAGFLTALIDGKGINTCLEAGTAVSARVITCLGTELAEKDWKIVNEKISRL